MSTIISTPTRPTTAYKSREERSTRRKKDQRPEIWTNLLRQTREAQARSRTQAVQARNLVVCGGSPEDQRAFVQTLARPPPPQPPGRAARERRPKGEVVLSNRYAYGYGHMTLYSPPPAGVGLLGAESEEVVKIGVHTVLDPEPGNEETLRRVLQPRQRKEDSAADDKVEGDAGADEQNSSIEEQRPSLVLLLSWKEPWKFLGLLRRWLQLLSWALLQPNGLPEDPIEVLKEKQLSLTVILQHVEAQEQLERENYKEESFDYISQCLRTCLLPLSAALVYMPSVPAAPPNAQGAPLSEVQKVLYTSLGLDLAALSPASKVAGASGTAKKEDLLPKHNVVDRMAIVVPSGWDSLGKIRLLSETFSPESVLEGWSVDVNTPAFDRLLPPATVAGADSHQSQNGIGVESGANQIHSGAEQFTYEATGASSPFEALPDEVDERPISPSKLKSAISSYEQYIQDPQGHKAPQSPRIEVTTKPEQEFLAEMRSRLQQLDEMGRDKKSRESGGVSSTAGRGAGLPSGESSGALHELGDINFNVGGVNYNAITAEAAIERLKRPAHPSSSSESPRIGTPRLGTKETPKIEPMEMDRLEEYFHSLMKRGGGAGSAQSTPSKPPTGGQ